MILHGADLAAPPPQEPAAAESADPVQLEVRFHSLGSAEQLLLFGPAVEVLKPAELRDALVRRAQETIALYGGAQQADSGHRPDSSVRLRGRHLLPRSARPPRRPRPTNTIRRRSPKSVEFPGPVRPHSQQTGEEAVAQQRQLLKDPQAEPPERVRTCRQEAWSSITRTQSPTVLNP